MIDVNDRNEQPNDDIHSSTKQEDGANYICVACIIAAHSCAYTIQVTTFNLFKVLDSKVKSLV